MTTDRITAEAELARALIDMLDLPARDLYWYSPDERMELALANLPTSWADLVTNGRCIGYSVGFGSMGPYRRCRQTAQEGTLYLCKHHTNQGIDQARFDGAYRKAKDELMSLARTLERIQPDGHDWVYAIGDEHLVKVGYSTNPENRLVTLKRSQDATIIPKGFDRTRMALLGVIPGGMGLEKHVQRQLWQWKITGEWYIREPVTPILNAYGFAL